MRKKQGLLRNVVLGLLVAVFMMQPLPTLAGNPMHPIVRSLDAGNATALVVDVAGSVWAWGHNGQGIIGDGQGGAMAPRAMLPKKIEGLSGVKKVSVYGSHALAVKYDGTVWAWGYGSYGSMGIPGNSLSTPTLAPTQVVGVSNVVDVVASEGFSLALTANGDIWGWGKSVQEVLGTEVARGSDTPTPVLISEGSNIEIVKIAAGKEHALALDINGNVYAWGYWEVTSSGFTIGSGKYLEMVDNMNNAIDIAAGDEVSLVLKEDGTVWTWGRNVDGILGANAGGNQYVVDAVQVAGLSNITKIDIYDKIMAAVGHGGTVWMWGKVGLYLGTPPGVFGDISYPTTVTTPMQVNGVSNVTDISVGSTAVLAIDTIGVVWGWSGSGNNLGIGSESASYVAPTPIRITPTTPSMSLNILDNKLTVTNSANGGNVFYSLDNGSTWLPYTEPLTFTSGTVRVIHTFGTDTSSWYAENMYTIWN